MRPARRPVLAFLGVCVAWLKGGTVSVPRCRFAARSGKLPLVGLLLASAALLLLPAFALAFLPGDNGGCLCQSPQPPGDPLTVVALLDACHGWLGGGPVLVTTGCRSEAVTSGALIPQGCAWTIASVGRSPPLAPRQVRVRKGRDRAGRRWHQRGSGASPGPLAVASSSQTAEGTMRDSCPHPCLGLLLALLAAPALASPKTFYVHPSGGNDTANPDGLQRRRQGRAGQHRAAHGRPLLHQHHLRAGFKGTFRGAGEGKTVIDTLPGVPVAVQAGPVEPFPFLFAFSGGNVCVSDMSFDITAASPAECW